jgi:hypothetical protein
MFYRIPSNLRMGGRCVRDRKFSHLFPFLIKKTPFQNVRVQRVQDGKLGVGAESATGTSL